MRGRGSSFNSLVRSTTTSPVQLVVKSLVSRAERNAAVLAPALATSLSLLSSSMRAKAARANEVHCCALAAGLAMHP